MKKNITAIMFIAATLLLAGCGSGQTNNINAHSEEELHDHSHNGADEHSHSESITFLKSQAEAIGLQVEKIEPQVFSSIIKTSGQILSAQGDESTIVATSNGVVSFVNSSFVEGSAVAKEQIVAYISAKNLLDGDPGIKAKIAYETASKEYARAEGLVKDNIISAKEYEQIRMRYETAKTAYQGQASNTTDKGVSVKSPIEGYIKNIFVLEGSYVSVGQPIAMVSQNKRLQLRAEVSEKHFKSLKNINGANFKVAYDNDIYKLSDLNGSMLSYGKTSSDQSFYIPITFEFDNIGDIIPGSFTEVYLLTTPKQNVLSVPVGAITEEQGLYFVYLKLCEEDYKKQEVTLGQNNGERVEVLSGLTAGDMVVVTGSYQVKLAATSSVIPEGHNH